jgi:flagellar basal body-associated protein FliL
MKKRKLWIALVSLVFAIAVGGCAFVYTFISKLKTEIIKNRN